MKRFELIGMNHKAVVQEYDAGSAELFSYGTKVATVMLPHIYREEGQPQTNTTARHMREFAMLYGFPRMTKAELLGLPTL